jgi:4-amino-4-deoxy-L-arabinose transferase-like glycosyltransferase
MRHGRRPVTHWWPWLGLFMVLGLAIRLDTVYSQAGKVAGGDAYYYYNAAKLLVAGHGFINPYLYIPHGAHHIVQSADFPPLFIFALAIPSVVGLKSFLVARVWCCVLGTAAIGVCQRVGLIAAFLLAVYPNIWMTDELALSEALAPLLIATLLLFAYRFWKEPSVKRGIWLGVVLGIAMLGRDELTSLVVFLVVPLVLFARALSWKRRFAVLGIALLATALVVAPWVGYNLSRFQKPVFISTGLGVTLASADCAATYSGPAEGYWSMPCALADSHNPWFKEHPKADDSAQGAEYQHLALDYVRAHENRLVPVSLAKIGRALGFFHPLEQISFDSYIETRPYHWALVGLGMYYALLGLSIGGAVILRRRRIPSFPMWAIGLEVVCSVVLTFGQTRYRTTFEVSLVLMAAVTLDAIWSALRRGRNAESEADPTDPGGPGGPADPASGRPLPSSDTLPGERLDEPALTS